MRLEEILTEAEVAKFLGCNIGKEGRSRTITRCISEGLNWIELYGKRYFLEEDVVFFIVSRKQKSETS